MWWCRVTEKRWKRGTFTPIRFIEIDGRIRAIRAYDGDTPGRLMFSVVPLMPADNARLCPYHADSSGWDACTEGFEGRSMALRTVEAERLITRGRLGGGSFRLLSKAQFEAENRVVGALGTTPLP